MQSNSGKTIWDFIHVNPIIKYLLVGLLLIIVIAVIFFAAKGYSITTTGISPPHETQDSVKLTTNHQSSQNSVSNNIDFNRLSQIQWIIFFLALINMFLLLIVLSTQLLNRKNNNYIGSNLKKVEVFEHIYKTFVSFTLYDRDQSPKLLEEIQALSKYTIENGLYIDKYLQKLINENSDYFKEVIVDYRKKDYAKEMELQNKFKRLFR